MTDTLTEMDAFELRWQLVHGLHPSDGLVVHVVSATSLMVVGTDITPHPKHGIYMATGRHLLLRHEVTLGPGMPWIVQRHDPIRVHVPVLRLSVVADLDDHLAWVRQRLDT